MANNIVSFGLKNVHYSIATQANDGTWSFATPVALKGAQEFTSDIVGGSTPVYADDQSDAHPDEPGLHHALLSGRKMADGNKPV